MQFLNDIRYFVQEFESEASDEIHKFIDFLHTKYVQPTDAVPSTPIVTSEVLEGSDQSETDDTQEAAKDEVKEDLTNPVNSSDQSHSE